MPRARRCRQGHVASPARSDRAAPLLHCRRLGGGVAIKLGPQTLLQSLRMTRRQVAIATAETADQAELRGNLRRRRPVLFGHLLDGRLERVGLADPVPLAERAEKRIGAVVEPDGDGAHGGVHDRLYYIE